MNTRALATGAAVILVLVLGVVLLYAYRAQAPSVTGTSTATARVTSTAAVATAAPTPTSTATTGQPPQPGAPKSWASTCGTVSEFVSSTGTANGSFVLSSPGRLPLRVTVPAQSSLSGPLAGYICGSIYGTGAPSPTFVGLWAPGTPGFIPDGTVPATKAEPALSGFVLPQACAYTAPPVTGADQTEWWVDCGATANRDARGTLAPPLTQQGWTSCGAVTATATWAKGTARLVISESPGSVGDYPKLSQPVRPATTAGCP
ncbi:MAG: hypothetical protein ABJB39_08330 [Chloroflexota bacterium]